jgi:hypothetical protein
MLKDPFTTRKTSSLALNNPFQIPSFFKTLLKSSQTPL